MLPIDSDYCYIADEWKGFGRKRLFQWRLCLQGLPENTKTSGLSYAGPDRLCGPVVIVSGHRSRSSGSIPGAARFPEKWWVWNGVHSAS
jgi:hypothetical protein